MPRASITPHGRRVTREQALAAVLEAYTRHDRTVALARDPIRFARNYPGRDDREVAALLGALMAFGNVETIGRKLAELFVRLGDAPGTAARTWSRDGLDDALRTFKHRTFVGTDIAAMLWAAGTVMREHGRLFALLEHGYARHGELRGALDHFVTVLRGRAWPDGLTRASRHLLPDPRGASACKRLVLLARWVVRADDGVDLGLADLPTRALVIPLDVHVHRVARELKLTHRASASWEAAVDVTEALRALDADDPVRFDFAVCHTEIAAVRTARAERAAARLQSADASAAEAPVRSAKRPARPP